MSDRPVVVRGPFVHVEATLREAARFQRRLWDWRPTIVPYDPSEQLLWFQPGVGVVFADGPEFVEVDAPFRGKIRFLTWPDPAAERFVAGSRFAIIEGDIAVAMGHVLSVEASYDVSTY